MILCVSLYYCIVYHIMIIDNNYRSLYTQGCKAFTVHPLSVIYTGSYEPCAVMLAFRMPFFVRHPPSPLHTSSCRDVVNKILNLKF